MTFEVICENCRHRIYQGMELKYVNDMIRSNDGKCRSCNEVFLKKDFITKIIQKTN